MATPDLQGLRPRPSQIYLVPLTIYEWKHAFIRDCLFPSIMICEANEIDHGSCCIVPHFKLNA